MTRQIAASMQGDPFWRISIADVTKDGPFSKFDGLERILTVIDGKGMILSMPDRDISATFSNPVSFSGNAAVMGLLPHGPIQDFNLIYDAKAYAGAVQVAVPAEIGMPDKAVLAVYYCLSGNLDIGDLGLLEAHSGVLNPGTAPCNASEHPALVLAVSLTPKS